MKHRTRYYLELEPIPGNWQAPPLARLKAMLKAAKRAWGLSCVSVRESAPEPPAPPATEQQTNV